jgi:ABC-type sugar transport system substrate-binding protein
MELRIWMEDGQDPVYIDTETFSSGEEMVAAILRYVAKGAEAAVFIPWDDNTLAEALRRQRVEQQRNA